MLIKLYNTVAQLLPVKS